MATIVDLVGQNFADTEIAIYHSADRLVIAVNRPFCIARLTVPPSSDDRWASAGIEIILIDQPPEFTS